MYQTQHHLPILMTLFLYFAIGLVMRVPPGRHGVPGVTRRARRRAIAVASWHYPHYHCHYLPQAGSAAIVSKFVISLVELPAVDRSQDCQFSSPLYSPQPFLLYIYKIYDLYLREMVELICQRMYFYSAKEQGEDHESTSFSPPIHKYFPVPLSPVPLPPNPLWLFQESCAFKAIRQCREGRK